MEQGWRLTINQNWIYCNGDLKRFSEITDLSGPPESSVAEFYVQIVTIIIGSLESSTDISHYQKFYSAIRFRDIYE